MQYKLFQMNEKLPVSLTTLRKVVISRNLIHTDARETPCITCNR